MKQINNIPKPTNIERLLDYVGRLSKYYSQSNSIKRRKSKGQIFTPKKVSQYMVSMFDVDKTNIRILDPGAGTGVLTAAFCERLIKKKKNLNIVLDVYENDPKLIPLLQKGLEFYKEKLLRNGHRIDFNIYDDDFIFSNVVYFKDQRKIWSDEERILYDYIISNPPYYKLNKNSPQATAMKELVSGQPNIYAFFMALSVKLLKPNGEMVFITPRSFCSGLYYKRFREWFLKNVVLSHIHIFESRKDVFKEDKILQENIIIKVKKASKKKSPKKVLITVSQKDDFKRINRINVKLSDIIHKINGDIYIRIPTTRQEVKILNIIDKWPNFLQNLGLNISTGPVVPFRAKRYLLPNYTKVPKSAPLLWMHNLNNMNVVWPLKKNKKESAIRICDETTSLTLPVNNYVLVNRFSSKEQKRRIFATVLLKSEFPFTIVGIENHVNYIHRPSGDLSTEEAIGIASIINTSIIDKYFRTFNGNTQVNASDVRNLPLPSMNEIRIIGKKIMRSKNNLNPTELDNIVAEILGINSNIMKGDNR